MANSQWYLYSYEEYDKETDTAVKYLTGCRCPICNHFALCPSKYCPNCGERLETPNLSAYTHPY